MNGNRPFVSGADFAEAWQENWQKDIPVNEDPSDKWGEIDRESRERAHADLEAAREKMEEQKWKNIADKARSEAHEALEVAREKMEEQKWKNIADKARSEAHEALEAVRPQVLRQQAEKLIEEKVDPNDTEKIEWYRTHPESAIHDLASKIESSDSEQPEGGSGQTIFEKMENGDRRLVAKRKAEFDKEWSQYEERLNQRVKELEEKGIMFSPEQQERFEKAKQMKKEEIAEKVYIATVLDKPKTRKERVAEIKEKRKNLPLGTRIKDAIGRHLMMFGLVTSTLGGMIGNAVMSKMAYAEAGGGAPIETVADEDALKDGGGEVETNIYDAVKEANGYKEVDSSKEIYSPDILDQANNAAGETGEAEEEGSISFEVTDENGEKVKESFKRVEGGYNEEDDEYFAEGKSSLGAFTGRHETFGEMVNAAIRSPEQIAIFEAMRGVTGSRNMADVNWQANNMAEDADGFDARANDTLEWLKEVMQGGRIESYNIPEGTTRITFYMAKDVNTEDSTYIYATAINGENAVDAIRLVDGEGNYVLDQYKPAMMEMAGIPADQADYYTVVWLKECNQIALVRVGREAVRQQAGSSTVTRGGEDTTSSSTVTTTTTTTETGRNDGGGGREEQDDEEEKHEEEKHEEDLWAPKPKGPDTHAGDDQQKMEKTDRSEETKGERPVDTTDDNMGRSDVAPTSQVDDADSAAIRDNAPQQLEEIESSQEASTRTSVDTGYSEDTSTAQPGAVTDTVVDAPSRTIVEEVPGSLADAGSVDTPDENLTAAQLGEQLRAAEGQGAE